MKNKSELEELFMGLPYCPLFPDLALHVGIAERMRQDKELAQKSFDKSAVSNYLSSADDSSAGLFVPEDKRVNKLMCSVCKKEVEEEEITECQNPRCPFTHLDKIVGDAKPDNLKMKEDTKNA